MLEPDPWAAVICSCGRTALLTGPKETADGKYRASEPEWRYHSDPEDEQKTRLWHCGRDGHYQAALVPSRTPVLTILKLLRASLEAAQEACRKALDAFGHEPIDRDNITEKDAMAFDAILHLVGVVDAKDWAAMEPLEPESATP